MKVVADTDIISTFARIQRLDTLDELFDEVIVPLSVKSELAKGQINAKPLAPTLAKLSKNEVKSLKAMDTRLGRGEKECIAIAKTGASL